MTDQELFLKDMKILSDLHGWNFANTYWNEKNQEWDDMYSNWMWWAWKQGRVSLKGETE